MNFNIFLTKAIAFNLLFSIGIVTAVVLILILQRNILKKEDALKHWFILVVYFVTFAILLAAILGLFAIWGFDLALYIATTFNDIILSLTANIGRIISSLIVIFITLLLFKLSKTIFVKFGVKDGSTQRRRKTVGRLLSSITKYTLGLISIIAVLSIWGVNVGPALAGLGIIGLVVGLGAQKFINDLIAGFFIVFEQHYDVEDVIEVQGFKGVVTDIGLKTTRIRNWKGEIKILANGDLTNITNFSKNLSLAVVEFSIAYKEDIQKTFDVLNENLPKFKDMFEQIVEPLTVSGVTALNPSSVDIRVIAKTLNLQHYNVERALRKFIKELLNEHNIEIPFPQVVVHKAE